MIGVIGGSGIYNFDALKNIEKLNIETPYGAPSSEITVGELDGNKIAFIARHGVNHQFIPTEVPYRANIYALKTLGVQWCIGVGAVGSLREEYAPRHVMVPDQLLDRTQRRVNTFFGDGIVGHTNFADPFCETLRQALIETSKGHTKGTYVCMEGPAFSTRAESHMYRSLGADIIGMTAIPEAKLAREAGISYALLALITDYDCWRTSDADVDVSEILDIIHSNAAKAREIIREAANILKTKTQPTQIENSLQFAIVTKKESIPARFKNNLIFSKYLD